MNQLKSFSVIVPLSPVLYCHLVCVWFFWLSFPVLVVLDFLCIVTLCIHCLTETCKLDGFG